MNLEMKQLTIGIAILILLASFAAYFNVTSNAAAKPIRVACVGDSITEGSGYPFKLHQLLGPDYTVGNFGVSGSTVSLNSKKPYMNESKFQEAINFNPEIVIIMLGTNDANLDVTPNDYNFEADYRQLITSFQNNTDDLQIFVLRAPPIFDNNANYNKTYLSSTVIPHIDNLTTQMNLPKVDIYSVLNQSEYFMDGVHPNSEGATLIAESVYDTMIS
jgi:acyl-CoA thioesterase I